LPQPNDSQLSPRVRIDFAMKAYLLRAELSNGFALTAASRPFGITLLAILHVLQAIIYFLGGIALIALGALMRRGLHMPRFLHGVVSVIGVVIIIVAFLYLVLAWGLWTGRGWAWTVSLVLAILGIIIAILSLLRGGVFTLLVLVLDAIIVYYLYTPNVRSFFGEYKPLPQVPPPAQTLPPTPPAGASRSCPNCGAPVLMQDKFCTHCGKPVP